MDDYWRHNLTMPIIPGIIASELSGHLQPQPPIIDTISGAVVISGGTTSGSNSIVQINFTQNPYGQRATSYTITAFSGSPLVAVTGTTVTGANSPLNITYPFVANAYYQFKGTAINAKGTSSYGNASNQIEPFVATATPSGLSVSGITTSGVRFTFLQVPGSTSYVLSATGTLTNTTTNITTYDSASVVISGTEIGYLTVTGTLNHGYFVGMPYEFYVQSQNFAGTSASGANISLTPNPFGPPLAPVFTAAISGVNTGINVVITPDTNVLHNLPTGYFIGDLTGGFSSTTQSQVTATLNDTVTPIQPVSTINVYAKNSYTNSIGSSGTPGTPIVFNFPPAAVTSVNTQSISYSSASVAWTPTAGNSQYSQPTTYNVALTCSSPYDQVSTSVPYATNIATLNGSKTFTLYGTTYTNVFQAGASYTPTVVAQNTGGSSTSATTTAIIPNPLPNAVTSVSTSSVTTTSGTISWTPAGSGTTPATYVALMVGSDSTSFYTSVAYGTNSAIVTGSFTKGITYTPTVISITAGGAQISATGTGIIPNPKPTVTASGATHYSDSNYDYAVWRTTGTLLITTSNLAGVEILAVGAGGGGGAYRTISTGVYAGGGGGGGGQILAQSYGTLPYNIAMNVFIGAGGNGGSSSNGGLGGDTSLVYNVTPFTTLFISKGGGGGGYNAAGSAGANGGGGAGNSKAGGAGQNASQGQSNGYNGGTGFPALGSTYFAGGGGGAGSQGSDGSGGATSSNGGAGLQFNDWATATSTSVGGYYAGGGGGAGSNNNSGSWSVGGTGGGGTGASLVSNPTAATSGTANTGGGGGGAAGPSYSTAGTGGTGLFIIRWPLGTALWNFS
jgi:hypothetical protein